MDDVKLFTEAERPSMANFNSRIVQINGALLNKANNACELWPSDFNTLLDTGFYHINRYWEPEDIYHCPLGGELAYYEAIVSAVEGKNRAVQIVAAPYSQHRKLFVRYQHDGVWSEWGRLATATPPEEHALPLAEGWTAGRKTKFSVSQDSLVLVTFGVWGPANMSDRAVIAQLPPGFRPGELISTGCMVTDESTYTRYPAGLDVNRAGEVIVFSKQPGWTIAVGQVAFYVSTRA